MACPITAVMQIYSTSLFLLLVDLELQNRTNVYKERRSLQPIMMAMTHLMTSQITSLPKNVQTEKVFRHSSDGFKTKCSSSYAGMYGGRTLSIQFIRTE